MKRKTFILIAVLAFSLGGCNIFSLFPLYTVEELIANVDFEGTWTDNEGGILQIERTLKGNQNPTEEAGIFPETYTYTYSEDGKSSSLYAHLIQLGNTTFMDLFPTEDYDQEIGNDLLAGNLLPVHTFYKVEISHDQLVIHPYKLEWLDELFEQNRIRISHETIPYYGTSLRVLTATTQELQKFVTKYADDQEAFEEPDILQRKL